MVAAKLDQSRVLVTKFRQNRLTLKGRSAGQRHTDRQTHRQTRLKIMALQVCNRANRLRERPLQADNVASTEVIKSGTVKQPLYHVTRVDHSMTTSLVTSSLS